MNKLLSLILIIFFYSCSSVHHFTPGKKYPREVLQEDYSLMRNILEKKHPSLYWYTSKDSMNMYFDRYYGLIGDSMTEQQFTWRILAPVISKVRCGHTSLRASKGYEKWAKYRRFPSFPLNLKIWKDSMVVTSVIGSADSNMQRGTIIKSINGMTTPEITRVAFEHMHADGYANNFNYIKLSSGFPYYHRNLFGLPDSYRIGYIDKSGIEKSGEWSVYKFSDSLVRKQKSPVSKPSAKGKPSRREARLLRHRSLTTDSSGIYALMTINSFSKGNPNRFFRKTFKKLDKEKIGNLIIDLRSNGGGKIASSTLLSRYVSREPFRIADTLVTFTRSLAPYTGYAKGKWLNNLGLTFMTQKKPDGSFHIKHYEQKKYKPFKKHHFDGKIIILVNGPTFSASTLFCNVVKGQAGITLLGEETGGGWHGNNGVIIPDITLPRTGIRFRLPLFRLVQFRHVPRNGKGITPDIWVGPSLESIRKGIDKKMEVALDMIRQNNQTAGSHHQDSILK